MLNTAADILAFLSLVTMVGYLIHIKRFKEAPPTVASWPAILLLVFAVAMLLLDIAMWRASGDVMLIVALLVHLAGLVISAKLLIAIKRYMLRVSDQA